MKFLKLFKRELGQEILLWEKEGLLTPETADKILMFENIERSSLQVGTSLLKLIAGFLVGLGVILLLNRNWNDIPEFVRLIGLVSVTLFVQYRGIKSKEENGEYSGSLLTLGAILFGATVFLVGQMYHLGLHFNLGFLLWALGVVPLGYLSNILFVSIIGAVSALVWMQNQEIAWAYPLLALPGFVHAIKRDSIILFLVSFVGAFLFGAQVLDYFDTQTKVKFLLSLGLLPLALSIGDSFKSSGIGAFLKLWSLRGMLLLLFIFSWAEYWEDALKGDVYQYSILYSGLLLFGVLSLILNSSKWGKIISLGSLSFLGIIPFITSEYSILLFILTNLFIVFLSILFMVRGIQNKNSKLFTFGAFYLISLALARFFSVDTDYVVAGLVFILVGVFFLFFESWLKRRLVA
jgi:uncharacterized membrane protein